jgi:hypothetical protein
VALKKAQAVSSTIEAVTALVSPQAANIERAGFAVLGVVINAIEDSFPTSRASPSG